MPQSQRAVRLVERIRRLERHAVDLQETVQDDQTKADAASLLTALRFAEAATGDLTQSGELYAVRHTVDDIGRRLASLSRL